LPIRPAGRIPARAAERAGDFAAAARSWLDPMLHASAGRPKAATPPPPAPPRATVGGARVVLLLAGVFVTMSLVVCGLAFCDRTVPDAAIVQVEATLRPQPDTAPRMVPMPASPPPRADPCPKYRLPGTPTRADAGTTERVHAAWKRIENWLAARAPASRRSLRPPASAAAIARVQQEMSVEFPPDLVASLRRHDGVTGGGFALPFLFEPLAVDAIPREWSITCGVLGNEPDDDWWHRSFVPFATAGDGGCLLVDQRPGGHGRVGEFYPEEGVDFARWPASVTELLERTARSLETGRPYDDRYRPTVTREGVLDWEVL
jgi:cell wall assembly regulator SMI1